MTLRFTAILPPRSALKMEGGLRTYVPERRQKSRCWTDKPAEYEKAFRANRRRVRGTKGRQLNRWRSERCERTFAHVCETGGGRRTWLRGQRNVSKTYTFKCAAYNLGLLLRKVWGLSKPRNGAGRAAALFWALFGWLVLGASRMAQVIGPRIRRTHSIDQAYRCRGCRMPKRGFAPVDQKSPLF